MKLKEEYQKATNKSPHLLNLNDGELVTTEYVMWLEEQILDCRDQNGTLVTMVKKRAAIIQQLEQQIPLREQAAWEVRGETEPITSVDGWIEQTKYFTIEEWRKSHTK